MLADLWLRLRALVRPRRVERELRDELAFHLAMEERKHRTAGANAAEARRLARRSFGSSALAEDGCRDARGIGLVDTVWQDVRYAVRTLRRSPTFAATVIATIALGLGVNTAVFTIFNAYVLTPFAISDPYTLYEFGWTTQSGRVHRFSWEEFTRLRDASTMFSEMYAERFPVVGRVDGHIAYTSLVTGNYFRMLGIGPALGRVLEPADATAPGREPVVVLSHGIWQRLYGADPTIVGRTILVQGYPCEVVGVARAGFVGLSQTPPYDLWAPITMDPAVTDGPNVFAPGTNRLGVVGRLRPGVTRQAVEAALLVWAQHETETAADANKAATVWMESRATPIAVSPAMLIAITPIVAAFALVLLTACANVANMMLARGLARQREIGIRLTLGAGRRRLVRQLLTESALLAVPAAAAASLVARAAVAGAARAMFATMPTGFVEFMRLAPLEADGRVLLFTMAAAFVTAFAFGLAPALQTTRANVMQMARGDFGSDFGPARLRRALVVIQITASVTLLITSAVLVRSTQQFASVDPGIRVHDVVSIDIREPFRARVLQSLATNPEVTTVGAALPTPLNANASAVAVRLPGETRLLQTRYRFASPEFFEVFDVPILGGRTFTADEARSGAALAIVSETAAREWWPNGDAIGRTLAIVPDARVVDPSARIRRHAIVQVIGVARDTAVDISPVGLVGAGLLLPIDPHDAGAQLTVRVKGKAEAARRSLDEALATAAPGAVRDIHTLTESAAGRLFPFRAASSVAGAVGILALVLTLSGVYGVLSYLVSQRSKEIAIRVALGARLGSVVGLVIAQSMRFAACGAAIGVVIALAAARMFGFHFVILQPYDPFAYCAGVVVVFAACVLASWFPARRASRIDPMTTLRAD
jgi:putative ABC transport system permease protein